MSDSAADQTRAISLWNVTYSTTSKDAAYGVAADTSGRVFIAGLESWTKTSYADIFNWRIMALNASDGTSLWNITYGGATGNAPRGVAVAADSSSRLFITGPDRGPKRTYDNIPDWRIMALNATDGASLWNVTYSNASEDIPFGIAADSSDRIFVVGFEVGVEGGHGDSNDWRTMALNASDGASLWNVTYSNTSADVATCVAADNSGRVFIAGTERGIEGGGGSERDWRIMALNAADGASLWNRTYSNASEDVAYGVAADSSGRIFVAGREQAVERGHGDTDDWRIMALNATDGASLWNRTYSNASDDVAYGVAVDTSGRVFVAGYETGVGGGHGGTWDWRIMALNATDGASLWNLTYSNASNDYASRVAVDTSDRIFIVGYETGVGGGHGSSWDWRIMALQHILKK